MLCGAARERAGGPLVPHIGRLRKTVYVAERGKQSNGFVPTAARKAYRSGNKDEDGSKTRGLWWQRLTSIHFLDLPEPRDTEDVFTPIFLSG